MASKLSDKIIHGLKNSRFLRSAELKEFDNLIKAIGECKSKAEEDRIIVQELETLKHRLSDPKLDKQRGREYMVRCIYCEMLGHDASFAYVKALQFASETNVHTKKAAYLALTQFLNYDNELILLLVNTLLVDLKSDNFIVVSSALVVCTKLIGPDLITAVYPLVIERLAHPKETVRKKAIMVLQRFHQLDPTREGALAGVDLDRHFRTMLCDKDPSVMSASLCALYEVIRTDPKAFKNLIPSFTSILKQVSEHRLPKTYDYHRYPAPFIQIKLLKILSILGAGDRFASENMYTVLQQALKRTSSSHTIGSALIAEYVRTITTIYPNPSLLAAAAEAIALFLKSSSHNLRYVGIDALSCIVKINPQHAQDHQLAVIDCLEDPDDTLKLKTLELLYKMTKANNVEVIVEKMLSYLRGATDEHIRRDIARKVSELAERYAPSPKWFIAIVSEVFELAGDHVEPQLAHNLMHLIAEQDEDLHVSAVEVYMRLLDKPKLPPILQEVICWVLGEYGSLASQSTTLRAKPQDVMSMLVKLYGSQRATDNVRALTITALAKIVAQTGTRLGPEAEELLHKASCSQNLELQQRAYELQAIVSSNQGLQMAVLPADASCEDFEDHEMQQLPGLTFLNGYVAEALARGATPYVPPEQRAVGNHAATNASAHHLRFEAYEPTAAPNSAVASGHHRTQSQGPPAHSNGDMMGMGGSFSQNVEPTLRGPAGSGTAAVPQRRWGPAEFTSSQPQVAVATVAPPAVDLLGGLGAPSTHRTAPSERDLLAASIFGGGANQAPPGHTRTRSTPPQAQAPAPAQASNLMDLMDFDTGPPAAQPPPQYQQQRQQGMGGPTVAGLDLLGGFGAPTPAPAPVQNFGAPPMQSAGAMDLLGGLGGGGGSGFHGSSNFMGGQQQPQQQTGGGFQGSNNFMGGQQPPHQQAGGAPYGMLMPMQGGMGQPHMGQQFPPQQQQQQMGQQQMGQQYLPQQQQQQQMMGMQGGLGGAPLGGQPMMGGNPHQGMHSAMRPAPGQKPPASADPFADLLSN